MLSFAGANTPPQIALAHKTPPQIALAFKTPPQIALAHKTPPQIALAFKMDKPALHTTLLAQIAAGNDAALTELYVEFKSRVFNTALSLLQNHADAEEVTQDVFVKIHQSAARFEGKSSVSTWIYRITVRQSLDRLRYRTRVKRFGFIVRLSQGNSSEPALDLPHFEHPGVLLEQRENAQMLFNAIESLPEQQKTAFILSFVEMLPRLEVADVMELSLKAVESLLQRAKANLRLKLDAFYPDRRI